MSRNCLAAAALCAAARLLAVLATLLLVGELAWATAADAASAGADRGKAQPASPSTVTDASLKQKQQELAERRKHAEQLLSAKDESAMAAADREALCAELEIAKNHELVCALHREELSRVTDLQEQVKQCESELHDLRVAGPAEERPYGLIIVDDVQDQRDAEHDCRDMLAAELAAARELQQSTRVRHREAESKRRQLREKLDATRGDAQRQQLTRQLEVQQLACQLYAATLELRRTEIANKELEQQVNSLRTQYLDEKYEAIRHDVVFTPEHLKAVCTELDRLEADLQAQIPPLQAKLHELETRELDAQQKPATQDRVLGEAMADGWQQARHSLQEQIKLIQQRLRDLTWARIQWNVRYKVVNRQGTPEQLADWADQANRCYEQAQATHRLLEEQREALTLEIGLREKQLRVMRQTGTAQVAPWIEYQLGHMQALAQAYTAHLIQVELFERMLAKLTAAFAAPESLSPTARWFGQLRTALASAWNFEVTAVDDRPITVRKIVSGLLLFLVGLLVSRWLSRFVGNRLLPRLGMNTGAATAVQSIAFYILVVFFGFLAMDMVNIPLTVFTFFGGAVAIGVGFGSQTVISNFISGLILLAEQPIRVGDLVDIGGLCGNVEKIGARSTRVRTGANLEIIVPNSKLLEDNVTNWTLTDTRMRSVVKVGVAYGSPTNMVDQLLRQAVSECAGILPDTEPIVLFSDFGDNALLFEVHFWLQVRSMMQARIVESELRHRIDQLMRSARIDIAFPQRDIHLDTAKPLEVHVRRAADQEALSLYPDRAA